MQIREMHVRGITTALGVALALAAAAPAEAQLGGLGRRIAEKAAEKALPKPETPAAANERTGSAASLYTAERVDQFVAVVTPSVEQARQLAAWRRAKETFETKQRERTECMERVGRAAMASPDPNAGDEMERINQQLQAVNVRLQAATTDEQRAVLADSMQALSEAMTIATYPALKQCGPRPPSYGPEPRVDGSALEQRAKAAGFTTTSFGRMRERIAAWVLTGATEGLNAEALAVLQARDAQLQALKPYFETVQWIYWSDLNW